MTSPAQIEEPARTLPVQDRFDVIVVGGGMAGVAAAVAAARTSARVALIERYCALGGLATLGNVTMWLPLCDGRGHQVIAGLGEELLKLSVAELKQSQPDAGFNRIPPAWQPEGTLEERSQARYRTDFNPSSYLLQLEALVLSEGIHILYDTRCSAVQKQDDRITHVVIENKSGRSALACSTVVDTSGDAEVCVQAGEPTLSLDSNVPAGWFFTLTNGHLKRHMLSQAYSPRGEKSVPGLFFHGDSGEQVTAHIIETRKLLRQRLKELCAHDPEADTQILMPATMACFRMSRRLKASTTLEEQHIHHWFDDTIGLTGDWRTCGPVYSIPLSCLLATQTANLITAGRCISVDKAVWDITRAIPGCVVTGQAAGTAAALAAQTTQGYLHKLPYARLHEHLLHQNVLLAPHLVTTGNRFLL